ncbi:MAG: transcription termination/antitermination NusG family protein, partial [Christensenellaceae bacterium]
MEDKKKVEREQSFNKQERTDRPYWYVVYTYSGYENKVMDNLLKTVDNHGLHDVIYDVKVPMEETIEVKNGKRKHVQRKLFPGYVMVKMYLTDESWY